VTALETGQITVRLPHSVIERLLLVAEQQHQPVEGIVARIVSDSVESLTLQAEAAFEAELSRLSGQSSEHLQQSANAGISAQNQARLSRLIEKSRVSDLTPEEIAEREALLNAIEATAVTRAAARLLLKRASQVSAS
jgi:DNA polymerase III psi subunit